MRIARNIAMFAVAFFTLWLIASRLLLVDAAAAGERSGRWHTVRGAYIAEHSTCEACGGKGSPEAPLQVHHVLSYELYPERELDPENLITLCPRCHLVFGHLGDFKAFNPLVREAAARHLAEVKSRPYTKADAAKYRRKFSCEYQNAP